MSKGRFSDLFKSHHDRRRGSRRSTAGRTLGPESLEVRTLLSGGFSSAVTFPVGVNPRAVTVADFNNDGKPDLAVANMGPFSTFKGSLSVLLGKGDGSFQPAATTELLNSGGGQGFALSVAVGDFNGDRLLDVALNTSGTSATPAVEVMLGKGDGSFRPDHRILSVAQTPLSVAVGDFDRNGALDLMTANSASGTLSLLLGNGDGSFRPRVDLAVGAAPRAVAVGDFNADGRLDVAAAQQLSDTVSVLLGRGNGTFAPPLVFAASGEFFTPSSMVVGDVNGDGRADLAINSISFLDSEAFQVGVLLGNGDGTFRAPLLGAAQPGGSGDLALGDFNNDGLIDAAVADELGAPSGNLSVFAGNGDGTFQSLIRLDLLTGGSNPLGVAAGDLNGDGLVDLVAANTFSNTVGVLLNNSTPAVTATFSAAGAVLRITGNELDNTIVVSRDTAGRILVNNGAVVIQGGTPTVANTSHIHFVGAGGNDRLSLDETNGALPGSAIFGGSGNDVLVGGSGDDFIDGGTGNDSALLGAGDDTFQWNPGDGSDRVDGQGFRDTIVFNGSDVAEKFDISDSGSGLPSHRVRLTRDVGNVTMDLSGIEEIDLNANGGADTITVNDQTATDVFVVNLDLGGAGFGDGQADAVIINGTGGDDFGQIAAFGTVIAANVSFFPFVSITGAEGARDTLTVNTLGGNDGVDAFDVPANRIRLTINGGAGDDTILASQGNDLVNGGDGNDIINGVAGNDTIEGGGGNDVLTGGAGNDTYRFDTDLALGSDTIDEAGGGVDALDFSATTARAVTINLGLAAAQVVNAGLTLTLSASTTIENVTGGALGDTLVGNALTNVLAGGAGNDALTGGAGNDALAGGAGNDTYRFDTDLALGSDTINEAGGGVDTLDFSATTARAVSINLGLAGAQVVNAGLTLTLATGNAIENVTGGALNDRITGNGLNNSLAGGAGNDTIEGGGGNDVLTGGAGNDTFRFDTDNALGSDTINEAGGGVDTLDFSATTTRAVTINLGLAAAQVINAGLTLTLAAGNTIENILGGALGDTLVGNALNNSLAGGAGNDTLDGGAGTDTLDGGPGTDVGINGEILINIP